MCLCSRCKLSSVAIPIENPLKTQDGLGAKIEKMRENDHFHQILSAVPDQQFSPQSPANLSQLQTLEPENPSSLPHACIVNSHAIEHSSPNPADAIDAETDIDAMGNESDYVMLDAPDLALPLAMDTSEF